MSRKQLDILFSGGAIVLALAMLVLGFVMSGQNAFANDYVKDELSAQKINFATTEELAKDAETNKANPDENLRDISTWKAGSSCLVENAGKPLETGKQAECYGKYYIAMHMARSASAAKADGQSLAGATYATLGATRTELSAKIAAAKAATPPDTERAAALQKDLDGATSLRTTMQTGETLKGLLLTTYGFSIFGDKAGLAAIVCYIIGILLIVLGAAGFVHAFVGTKKTVDTKVVTPTPGTAGLAPR